MPFKFTLLGLETYDTVENTHMARKRTTKSRSQQTKFKKAVEYCHGKTKGRKSFGNCMRRRLKK